VLVFSCLGIDVAEKKWSNLTRVEKADRNNEIIQMCSNNTDENEVCVVFLS